MLKSPGIIGLLVNFSNFDVLKMFMNKLIYL